MHLIAAQSLLKATNDLAPSRSVIDSGSVEGKLVGVAWRWVMVAVRGASVELWDHGWNGNPSSCGAVAQHCTARFIETTPQWNVAMDTSHSGSDLH